MGIDSNKIKVPLLPRDSRQRDYETFSTSLAHIKDNTHSRYLGPQLQSVQAFLSSKRFETNAE